jgi:chemotaxis protein CheC
MSLLMQLTESENDQLRELINIGVSQAGDALSLLMSRRITVSIPIVGVNDAMNAVRIAHLEDEITVSVLLRIFGEIDGYVLIVFPRAAALHLLTVLGGKTVGDLRAIDPFDRSMFQEIGNVVTGGMLIALSKFLHVEMLHSVPNVVIDMGGAMLNSVSASMIRLHEEFMTLNVAICVDATPESASCNIDESSVGQMFLFVGPDAVKKILSITRAELEGEHTK